MNLPVKNIPARGFKYVVVIGIHSYSCVVTAVYPVLTLSQGINDQFHRLCSSEVNNDVLLSDPWSFHKNMKDFTDVDVSAHWHHRNIGILSSSRFTLSILLQTIHIHCFRNLELLLKNWDIWFCVMSERVWEGVYIGVWVRGNWITRGVRDDWFILKHINLTRNKTLQQIRLDQT